MDSRPSNSLSLLFFFSFLFFFLFSSPIISASMYRIEEGAAGRLSGEIHMVGGHLSLQGGAEDILLAHFVTSNPQWIPEIEWRVEEERGLLKIKQPITLRGLSFEAPTNHWEIGVGDGIPLDLDIVMGAAVGEIDLSHTLVESLSLKTGVGDVTVDLTNTPSLHTLLVQVGVGSLKLHLDSPRERDLQVDFFGGVGQSTIYLPWNIGVKIHVKGGYGRIKPQGFLAYDSTYVNETYGKTETSIYIEIWAGLGEIHLLQEQRERKYIDHPFLVKTS